MKIATFCLAKTACVVTAFVVTAFVAGSALAQTEIVNPAAAAKVGGIPQLLVDPSWPKPLPNKWILGQATRIRVDRFDHIWVVQRPGSLPKRDLAAQQNPPQPKCCVAAH